MSTFIFGIGLLAQLCFSARILVQWIWSERAHQLVSPTLYWVLSLLGSYVMFYYGYLRSDFSIIFGQFVSFYIYIANLQYKGVWKRIPTLLRWLLYVTPVVALTLTAEGAGEFVARFLRNEGVPLPLLIFGTVAQTLFSSRFIYQIIYSVRHGQSLMPVSFWALSLLGAGMILVYGLIRLDWILVLGQSFGIVAYTRNILIGMHAARSVAAANRPETGAAAASDDKSPSL
jgi:lipid-A-disaccharide synthase-like uncharacterized protein